MIEVDFLCSTRVDCVELSHVLLELTLISYYLLQGFRFLSLLLGFELLLNLNILISHGGVFSSVAIWVLDRHLRVARHHVIWI